MKFYVGVTDRDWFNYLAALGPDEVNFWQPGGTGEFKVLKPGELFLFKLKSPLNAIAGGGFFVEHLRLPLSVAWAAFERKNGTDDLLTFRAKILGYRTGEGKTALDPVIGCIILTEPFFFPSDMWIPQPVSWGKSIVQGKSYGTEDAEGMALWAEVNDRLHLINTQLVSAKVERPLYVELAERYREGIQRQRLGQGAFRVLVTEAYNRRCAVTGERTLPVLTAAHIKPFAENGPHDVRNGLLLRSDLHTLFDLGYLTVTPDYQLKVSEQIREEYENGREYYGFQDRKISLPADERKRPSREYLDWHNQVIFKP